MENEKHKAMAEKEIKLKNVMIILVDEDDIEMVMKIKWCVSKTRKNYYAKGYNRETGENILMHRYIMGVTDPKIQIDHKDGNGLNNTRANLRPANNSENQTNKAYKKPNATSSYLGVSKFNEFRKWRAVICKDAKLYHLGYFVNEIDAAIAYNKKAIELHVEFATLNKIPKGAA